MAGLVPAMTRFRLLPAKANHHHRWRKAMLGNRFGKSTGLGLSFLLLASAAALAQQPQASDPTRNLTPVTDQMLLNPPDGDWLMWRRTYNGYGYSPLEQINKDNVDRKSVV